ncbi:alginate O-acetyltransferase AlgX-related protein [Phenylobacterium sp.]|jgi:hypothetical protein|uniref:alginate O-acetyltransferase AlgX-related protein n=1 Tax=Phenylobacterium sp. TaxID=1871053 RepID=UPI002F411B44
MPEPMRLDEIRRLDAELEAQTGPGHPASGLAPGVASRGNVAVAGHDGFLFISNGANRWERQFLGELRIEPEWAPNWRALFEERQAQAAARGVMLWNLIVPEKQVIYPDKRWGPGGPTGERRPMMALAAHLGPEARLVYPVAELKAVRGLAPAYFRHNSHWTSSGCCVAAATLLQRMGVALDIASLTFPVERMTGRQDLSVHFFEPPPHETYARVVPAGEVVDANRSFETTGRNTGETYTVVNPRAQDPRAVLLFGDSYAFDTGLAAALSVVFAKVVFVWSKPVLWDLVEEKACDIVIWECAERFLAGVPET